MSTDNQNLPQPAAQEIDLLDLVRQLWANRRIIFMITGVCIILGVLVAVFSAKEYTATCEIVPQTNKNSSNNSMARLASLAGINMGNMAGGEQMLSPQVYPNLLNNASFQRELLQTPINIKGESEPITLLTYLSDKKYKKFSLIGAVMKYTVGLPSLIMQTIQEPQAVQTQPISENPGFIILNKEEYKAVKSLKKIVSVTLEEKKGYITLKIRMPQAYAAAQVAESVHKLLDKYITEFKIDKVQSNLKFIQERYDELKKEYEDIQMARARYKDSYQKTTSSQARTELERLDNQYNLAYNIFSEIAAQLEQAKIQVKETTPVLTVINPVSLPDKPTKPDRMMILAGFTFLGIVVGCGYVLIRHFLQETVSSSYRKEDKHTQTE